MQKEKFAKYIRIRAKELGLSITALAQQTHISRQSLYDLFSGATEQAKLSTIVNLANTLQVHPIYLLRQVLDQVESPRYNEGKSKNYVTEMTLIRDVTMLDNSNVVAGDVFTKTWEIKNTSDESWVNRKLVCMDQPIDSSYVPPQSKILSTCRGLKPTLREVPIKNTKVGNSVSVSVEFKAPAFPCNALSSWNMTDANGNICAATEGLSCFVQVVLA
ncbi:MAG: NBR1-Ig-like domain-containing protein [Methylococcales bacterium]|nr:NBR1-Ig-like domain-containing protein [Methylococcales bacterium]MDD5754738.1 NBR1-Ig-like domain-containing protein [Methylococcales bacterium]